MKKPISQGKLPRCSIMKKKKSSHTNTSFYNQYLKSKEWQNTRDTILHTKGLRCVCCGRTKEDGIKFNVHHSPQAYYYLGDELNHIDLMVVLCNICHIKIHRGGDAMGLFKKREEEWRDIKGWEGEYQVSNFGRVKSLPKFVDNRYWTEERILKPSDNGNGYLSLTLYRDTKPKTYYVHRLVAEAFLDNPDNLPVVNHKDECKDHNWVENLEWCDQVFNINHGTAIERIKENSPNKKPILQYTKKGEFIKEWSSISEATDFFNGKSVSAISNVLNGRAKSAYGYLWFRKQDNVKDDEKDV